MSLLHFLFVIAVGFLSFSIYEFYRRLNLRNANTESKTRSTPTVIITFSALLGVFLLLASIPGAFFGQPYWFTNKLYWVVEKVIEVFT